jgi:hypothetical protein
MQKDKERRKFDLYKWMYGKGKGHPIQANKGLEGE